MRKYQENEKSIKGSRRQRKKYIQHKKMIVLCMAAFLLGVLCGKIVFAKEESESVTVPEIADIQENETVEKRVNINQGREEREEGMEEDWKLVLVNSTHFMEEGYVPELTEIENGYYFDSRAVDALKEMLKAGRADGMDLWICSAYRTMEKQTSLYENKVQRLMSEEGLSYDKAYDEAGKTVAYPGTSEHQLGLAVDIVAKDYQHLNDRQAQTDEAKWLKEHCWEYGFILRYPVDKTEETGIIFEPWHYRYVGVEAAKEIMEQGICLEEYLKERI